jgi:hypothetical protein
MIPDFTRPAHYLQQNQFREGSLQELMKKYRFRKDKSDDKLPTKPPTTKTYSPARVSQNKAGEKKEG